MSGNTQVADRATAGLPQKGLRPRVLSGIQPTGIPHIGNYLGAMRHWAAEQEQYDSVFCVVDLHAITVPANHHPAELQDNIIGMAAALLAIGIDPQKSVLFIQSHIPAHAELSWILGCVTSLGWLNRMHQFKSKAGEDRENASAGLYTYPVLQAADILLYDADLVPVGDDQRQHIELTRDIAERFNERFGPTFIVPAPLIRESGARIMALDDPTAKMSKSHPEGAISLLDTPSAIKKKFARAVTDSERTITFSPERKGLYNLLTIYQLLAGGTDEAIEEHFAGKGYKELKAELTELLVAELAPIQQRYRDLVGDPAHPKQAKAALAPILLEGAARARPRAEATLARAKNAMGLG